MKDTDFPFFYNLFHGNTSLIRPDAIGVNNGLIFPIGPSHRPKGNGLFQNPFPNFDINPQNLPLNGSNLAHFSPQGSLGSSSPSPPMLGLSSTSTHDGPPLFEPYNTNGVSSKDHHLSTNFNSLPLAPPSHNGILHGLPSAKAFWGIINNQNLIPHQPHQPIPQTITYPSSLTFRDLGSNKSTTNLPDDDHVSCITTPDQKGQQKRVLAAQKKRRRMHIIRKASKAQKKANVIKGQWTPQEDRVLMQLVGRYGIRKWSKIAKALSGRVGKQCRERWHNHLRPDIRKDTWSEEEDKILIRAHKEVGNKWAEIARRLPGRSENTIKNHWNATRRRQNSKKRNKDPNCKGFLLQNYIRSIMSNQNDNDDNNNTINLNNDITVDKNDNDSNNTTSVDDDNDQGPQMQQQQQLLTDNSDVTGVDNWVINPATNLVYNNNNNNGNIKYVDLENDKSLYSESYGFRSFLDEMAYGTGMENESNVDFQMRSEIESLMKGPGEVKKEMDLMEMICQGKL